jgi:hypothetical protein
VEVIAGVMVAAGDEVTVAVEVAVGDGVLVAGTGVLAPAEQAVVVIVLLSRVTAPFCASARPSNVAPFSREIDVRARMLPTNEVVVSRVAELPIRHQTSQGSPPVTDESGDVKRADAVLKTQTPEPERVRLPVSKKLPPEQ